MLGMLILDLPALAIPMLRLELALFVLCALVLLCVERLVRAACELRVQRESRVLLVLRVRELPPRKLCELFERRFWELRALEVFCELRLFFLPRVWLLRERVLELAFERDWLRPPEDVREREAARAPSKSTMRACLAMNFALNALSSFFVRLCLTGWGNHTT